MGRLLGEWVPLEKKEAPVACKDIKESASSGPTLQYYRRGHAQCLPSSESRSRMCLSAGHQRQRGLPHPTLKAKRKHFPSKRCSKSLPTNGHRHLGSESQTFVTATGSKVERSSAPNQSRHNKNNNALPVENIALWGCTLDFCSGDPQSHYHSCAPAMAQKHAQRKRDSSLQAIAEMVDSSMRTGPEAVRGPGLLARASRSHGGGQFC